MRMFDKNTRELSKYWHSVAMKEAKQAQTMREKVVAMDLAKHYRMWLALSR